ncbi:hypothetical protein BIW16_09245 [Vibrio sp. OULL4]|nr:hypothetical protein BIW16_09245 [Vibrio sp. OULL4]
MCKTRHIQQRMSQRSIKQDVVDLVLQFGVSQGDKVVLTRKNLNLLIAQLNEVKHSAMDALKHGGVVVVDDSGNLITTYAVDSFRKRN